MPIDISKIKPIKSLAKKPKEEIVMFSLKGEPMHIFPTAQIAGRYLYDNHLTNSKKGSVVSGSSIISACKLKIKTAYGYQWRFAKDVLKESSERS